MTAQSTQSAQSSTSSNRSALQLYDTTLRDGVQREGLSFSLQDKLKVARRLDALGVNYIEGGYPGSNQRDQEFFTRARAMTWQNARIAAFGSTRYKDNRAEDDPSLRTLIDAETSTVTIVCKNSELHVREVLGVAIGTEPGHDRQFRRVPQATWSRGVPRCRARVRRLQAEP